MNYDPPPTMSVISFARQILDLEADRDHWRREALHYQRLHEMHCDHQDEMSKITNDSIGKIFGAVLDPDSGLNRAARAIERDPLKGAMQ